MNIEHMALAALLTIVPPAFGQRPAEPGEDPVRAAFEAATEDVVNPERGFSRFAEVTVSQGALEAGRQQGHSVFGLMITLSAFRDAPISDAFLEQIRAAFSRGRAAGVKFIPRFRYDSTAGGRDAPVPLVLRHISQLAPVLQSNGDVIVHVEAGFIGAWGEWHGSVNGLTDSGFGKEVNDRTRAIVTALLEAVPRNRMIAVRTPRYKKQLMGDDRNLTADEAFSGSARARLGFHNDCFLASETDVGTYAAAGRQAELDWLSRETRYVPHAGETCGAGKAALPYIACDNAVQEMTRTHWRNLNILWHPAVYDHWRANGCMDEIRRRLGYRFVLVAARAAARAAAGGTLRLQLTVSNEGFATPLNARPVEIVLRHTPTGSVHLVPLAADPRRWWAGETREHELAVRLPADIAPGEHEILISLPDASPTLRGDPRYAIRFANVATWEASTGYNNLGLRIRIR